MNPKTIGYFILAGWGVLNLISCHKTGYIPKMDEIILLNYIKKHQPLEILKQTIFENDIVMLLS